MRRRFKYLNPEPSDRLVEMLRKNTVAIVNQELVPVLKSNCLTQLLQRPGGTRMRSDVTMDQASAAVLDHHKYVQQLKRRRDGDEEITRNDPLGMQTEERRQRISPRGRRGERRGRYLFTVRGET